MPAVQCNCNGPKAPILSRARHPAPPSAQLGARNRGIARPITPFHAARRPLKTVIKCGSRPYSILFPSLGSNQATTHEIPIKKLLSSLPLNVSSFFFMITTLKRSSDFDPAETGVVRCWFRLKWGAVLTFSSMIWRKWHTGDPLLLIATGASILRDRGIP